MTLRSQELTLVGLLAASAVVAIVMLLTDDVLREFSPTHTYAVVGFIIIFALLIGILFWKPSLGVRLTLGWSVLLILAMLLDPITAGNTDSFTGGPVFGGYTTEEAFVYLWTQQAYYTFPILFALVVLTLVAAVLAWRSAPKG